MNPIAELHWWQRAVFYQIYPRSFADGGTDTSAYDGIGDFAGINAKLDYLHDLGIDAIWLSPHYPSPFLDCGYDISDYTGIAPEYGNLDDFKQFLEGAHARGIRVVLDLVLNHSSDQHPWFIESRSSQDNSKRDWYIWRDGQADGVGPPNNWASIFGGSAWAHDAVTNQYYYHAFLKEQPDLNWRNPELKRAMWDAVRFWLNLGVDGFRLDAIATIYEHPDLPNHTLPLAADDILDANLLSKPDYEQLLRHQLHQPGLHELMQELRALVDSYSGDRVLIGEDANFAYHGPDNDELHLVFNFPLTETKRLTPTHIRTNQAMRLGALPTDAWPCNTLGNHDSPRVFSRYGDGANNDALARLHAALLLTLWGTPFLFNGEEIGMADLELTELSQVRDTAALGQYRRLTSMRGLSANEAMQAVAITTRDRCRTPMQWDNTPNAGFSPAGVQPWLPVNPNYADGVNVADQIRDSASMLNFYKRLLHLRKQIPALIAGRFTVLHDNAEDYLTFIRSTDTQACLVVLNTSEQPQTVRFNLDLETQRATCLLSSSARDGQTCELSALQLAPFEIFIGELVK